MAGKKLATPQKGFRCEYAARYALSTYASTVPIPLQEDYYGHDLYCVLTRQEGKYLIPLYPFVVQVKTNDSGGFNKITYEGKEAIKWFFGYGLPFYIGLCYLDQNPRLDLYKTSEKTALHLLYGLPEKVTLHAYENPSEHSKLYDKKNIWMGSPLVSIELSKCGAAEEQIQKALSFWIQLDNSNLILSQNGITMYSRAKVYQTNVPPETSSIESKHFYNTVGLPQPRKRFFGAVLHNLALWQFLGKDGSSPKTPWNNLTISEQHLYKAICEVLAFLSEEEAKSLGSLYGYKVTSISASQFQVQETGTTKFYSGPK